MLSSLTNLLNLGSLASIRPVVFFNCCQINKSALILTIPHDISLYFTFCNLSFHKLVCKMTELPSPCLPFPSPRFRVLSSQCASNATPSSLHVPTNPHEKAMLGRSHKSKKTPQQIPPSFCPPSPNSSPSQLPKMPRKSFLKPTLATALALLAFYAFFNTFLSSFSNPNPDPDPNPNAYPNFVSDSFIPAKASVPAKIYVYDLPRKFTYGVIESYVAARGGVGGASDKYPGHQHSAEWWLFSDLMRSDRPDSAVERVEDPEEADLFYVPFFSSLSLVVNPIRPAAGFATGEGRVYSDEEIQEELVEWLEGQVYWRRNLGRDHVFICQDPNALYRVVDRVRNGVLLVSDFGRLRADQSSLVKDVILPYSHRINPYNGEVGVEKRNSLLFFMGNRYRKEVMFLFFFFF